MPVPTLNLHGDDNGIRVNIYGAHAERIAVAIGHNLYACDLETAKYRIQREAEELLAARAGYTDNDYDLPVDAWQSAGCPMVSA